MLLAAFFVLAFFAAGLGDYLETRYVLAVKDGNSNRAAFCSVAMLLVSATSLYGVLEVSPWILAPEVVGMWIGTKLAMR